MAFEKQKAAKYLYVECRMYVGTGTWVEIISFQIHWFCKNGVMIYT